MMNKSEIKLYSHQAIWIGTFWGGPLVAVFLIRRNFINTRKPRQGRNTLLIGMVATIVLLGAMWWISENTTRKIPLYSIPIFCSLLAYWFVEKFQGFTIRKQQIKGEPFYSAWRVIGVVFASIILFFLIGIGIWLPMDSIQMYRCKTIATELRQNEMKVFNDDMLNSVIPDERVAYINKTALPALQKNLLLMDKLELIKQHPAPKEFYVTGRQLYLTKIKFLELIRECTLAGKSYDNPQVNELNRQIHELSHKIIDLAKEFKNKKQNKYTDKKEPR